MTAVTHAGAQTLEEAGNYVSSTYLSDPVVQARIVNEFRNAKDAFDCLAIGGVFIDGVKSGEIPEKMSQAAMAITLFSNLALENMGFDREQIAGGIVEAMERLDSDGYYNYAFDLCTAKVKAIVGS